MTRAHTLSCILTAALLAGAAQAYQNKSTLAVELQAAIQRETVQGDIKGALKQYERILSRAGAPDRETAARALLRIGQCHEKLGSAEARKAYERLVREFGDQKDAVEAKTRLAALNPASTAPAERVLHAAEFIGDARPSSSGKFVAFLREGAICILDTASGTVRTAVAAPSDDRARHWKPLVSPDGSLIAYTHFGNEQLEGKGDLHVSRTDQTGDRILIEGSTTVHDYFSAVDWSADGSRILVARTNDQTRGLLIVPSGGGAVKELDTRDFNWWTGRRIASFSPDGQWIAYPSATPDQSTRGYVPTDVRIMPASGGESKIAVSGAGHDYVLGWLSSGELVTVSERSGRPRAYKIPVAAGQVRGEPVLLELRLEERPQDESVIGISREGAIFVNERMNQSELNTFRSGSDAFQKLPLGFQGGRPALSSDGSKLAYAVGGGGLNDNSIVIREMNTGRERVLPAKIPSVLRLTWFPDGKSLLAISNTGNYGRRPAFRMNTETGEMQPSADVVEMNAFYNPMILNDGQTLLYTARDPQVKNGPTGRIVGLNLATGAVRTLIEPSSGAMVGSFGASGDRSKIVYTEFNPSTRERRLLVSSLDNPQPKVVCQGANCRAGVPFFAPGDREIVFWKADENGAPANLWRVSVDGGEPQLFREAKWTMDGPVFHPTSGEIILGVDKASAKLIMKPLR
jgi:Tol biopolymer transport system component